MNGVTSFIVLLLCLFCCVSMTTASSLSSRLRTIQGDEDETVDLPINREEFPESYWFGTQNLFCVMGVTGSPSSSGRKKRAVQRKHHYASRYPLRFAHRLMYYKGLLYEWGTGTLGYFMGKSPSVVDCPIIWEEKPTGNSTCPTEAVRQFTYDYRHKYGVYNIATNNCHHFANRISELLSASNCTTQPSNWTRLSRRFWRYLGTMFSQQSHAPIRFNDIHIAHDRSTVH